MSDLPSALVYSLVTRMSAPVAWWALMAGSLRGHREKIGRVSPQDLLEIQGETLALMR